MPKRPLGLLGLGFAWATMGAHRPLFINHMCPVSHLNDHEDPRSILRQIPNISLM